MNKPRASIVIRTLNEATYLPELLQAIKAQRCEYRYEIIVIDSGSTDGTQQIAQQEGCRLLSITRKEFTFGRSLNRGCAAAEGEFLVFISGHCVPCHGSWLQRLLDPLENREVDYTYGRQLGGPATFFSEKEIFAKYFPAQTAVPQQGFYCNNANSALTKQAWLLHSFDEEITGLEDMHLARKLVNSGLKVGYVAEASVFHYHREAWSQVQRRFEREALALKQICPELLIRRRDLARFILAGVSNDLRKAAKDRQLIQHFTPIIKYRFNQYWGSYKGNRQHRLLTHKLRESYFYPDQSKGSALAGSVVQSPSEQLDKQPPMIEKKKIIALVPMKAHSARVSGKNVRNFCGKTLFRWILDTLLEVKEIDLVVINTDARDILKQNGLVDADRIQIRDRPKEICGDFVSMNKVIADDIANTDGDIYLMTHTTNPLLSAQTIRSAIASFSSSSDRGECDSLFTVDRIQTRFYLKDGSPVNHDPNNLIRTQDLEPWFEENSNLYIFTPKSFESTEARIGQAPKLFTTPKYESIDIDEPEDWDFAVATKTYLDSQGAKN